jgi:hypothetical protein
MLFILNERKGYVKRIFTQKKAPIAGALTIIGYLGYDNDLAGRLTWDYEIINSVTND